MRAVRPGQVCDLLWLGSVQPLPGGAVRRVGRAVEVRRLRSRHRKRVRGPRRVLRLYARHLRRNSWPRGLPCLPDWPIFVCIVSCGVHRVSRRLFSRQHRRSSELSLQALHSRLVRGQRSRRPLRRLPCRHRRCLGVQLVWPLPGGQLLSGFGCSLPPLRRGHVLFEAGFGHGLPQVQRGALLRGGGGGGLSLVGWGRRV